MEQLKEFWEKLPNLIMTIGGRILLAILIFFVGVQLIKFIRRLLKRTMERAEVEKGAIQFIDSFVKAALYVVLVVFIALFCGVDAAGLVTLMGSAGVAIGLAVQGSLSNLAGGVLILLLKPFKVGDYIIESGHGYEGTVSEIQIFYTKLLTADNRVVVLPNGNLANNSLVNVTASHCRRMDVVIGIAYDADLKKAKEVLQNVLDKDEKVLKDRETAVFVNELASSSVNIGVRCWFNNDDYWAGKWRITEECKYALDEAGIEIPFNQLDVHVSQE